MILKILYFRYVALLQALIKILKEIRIIAIAVWKEFPSLFEELFFASRKMRGER